jgi:hypothetical protein
MRVFLLENLQNASMTALRCIRKHSPYIQVRLLTGAVHLSQKIAQGLAKVSQTFSRVFSIARLVLKAF